MKMTTTMEKKKVTMYMMARTLGASGTALGNFIAGKVITMRDRGD